MKTNEEIAEKCIVNLYGGSVFAQTAILSAINDATVERDKRIAELESKADLWADEFQRIVALLPPPHFGITSHEIIGICERAKANIIQTVPLIEQRDKLERETATLRERVSVMESQVEINEQSYQNAITDNAALREHLRTVLEVLKEVNECRLFYPDSMDVDGGAMERVSKKIEQLEAALKGGGE